MGEWLGIGDANESVDYCSGAYTAGKIAGTLNSLAFGSAGAGAGAGIEAAEATEAAAPIIEEALPLVEKINCFVAGTVVTLGNGQLKPIEQIKVGDTVLSRDAVTGKTAAKKVEHTSKRPTAATIVLVLENGERIETTAEHPFYVEGRGFMPAKELGIGTSIVTRAGPSVKILSNTEVKQPNTVYNFTVADFHTYFVGKDELWVHNNCDDLVDLFRSVGPEELDDILRYGDYGLAPSGGGKYFSLTEQGARDFAGANINAGLDITVTKMSVPRSVLDWGFVFNDPGATGAGQAVHFADEVLPDVYLAAGWPRPPAILDAPWVISIGR